MQTLFVPNNVQRGTSSELIIESSENTSTQGYSTILTGSEISFVANYGSVDGLTGVMGPMSIQGSAIDMYSMTLTEKQTLSTSAFTTQALSLNLLSICWSAELHLFVAVGVSSIVNSTNGSSWTSQVSDLNLRGICWSPELSMFCAVGTSAVPSVIISYDGIIWETQVTPLLDHQDVCWSPELHQFCTIGRNVAATQNFSLMSYDGVLWTSTIIYSSNLWTAITWSPELRIFCAVSADSLALVSNDGISWYTYSTPIGYTSICWSSDLEMFSAASNTSGTNRIGTSVNGTTWVSRSTPSGTLRGVVWSSELRIFVVMRNTGGQNMTSTDGITWITKISLGVTSRAVCWSPELMRFCSAGVAIMLSTEIPTETLNIGNYGTDLLMDGPNTYIDGATVDISSNNMTIDNTILNDNLSVTYSTNNKSTLLNSGQVTKDALTISQNYSNLGTVNNYAPLNDWSVSTIGISGEWVLTFNEDLNITLGIASISTYIISLDSVTWSYGAMPSGTHTTVCWCSLLNKYCVAGTTSTILLGSHTSLYNISWTTVSSGLTPTGYYGSLFCSELGLIIIVGQHTTNNIITSPDGFNWTLRQSINLNYIAVTWAPEISTFCVVGDNTSSTNISISYNGISWTTVNKGTTDNMTGIVWSPELLLFCGTTRTNPNSRYFRSSDGISWAFEATTFATTTARIAWSPSLLLFCAAGENGTSRLFTSPDAITWTTRAQPTVNAWFRIIWNPFVNRFIVTTYNSVSLAIVSGSFIGESVVLGNNTCNTIVGASTLEITDVTVDSDTYLKGTINTNSIKIDNSNVLTSNNTFLSSLNSEIGIPVNEDRYNSIQNSIMSSWATYTTPLLRFWDGIAWSPELNLFTAVAFTALTATGIVTSSDGITWISRTIPIDYSWYKICWSPEVYLFVSVALHTATNNIMTSSDGITWTLRTKSGTQQLSGVCWSPELLLFIACGDSILVRSSDGINWNNSSTAISNCFAICWSSQLNLFCTVRNGGSDNQRIATSADGITWTTRTTPNITIGWRSICWSPELILFCAIALSGSPRYMTSSDGITWTTQIGPEIDARSIIWSSDTRLFTAVGNGTNLMIISANGINWTTVQITSTNLRPEDLAWSPQLKKYVIVAPMISPDLAYVINSNPFFSANQELTINDPVYDSQANLNALTMNMNADSINIGSVNSNVSISKSVCDYYKYIFLIRNTAQSIPDITPTDIVFNQVEYIYGNFLESFTRIRNTSVSAKLYYFYYTVPFTTNSNNVDKLANVLLNGQTSVITALRYGITNLGTNESIIFKLSGSGVILLKPNDYLTLSVEQFTGSPLNVGGTSTDMYIYFGLYEMPWY